MSQSEAPDGVTYRTSSFSGGSGGNCVEIGELSDGSVAVRHSRGAKDVPPLIFTAGEWAAFVDGVKAGEFDPR